MRRIAFIPARGRSKGIPGKNLVLLDSKPLIDYTIQAAQDARIFARIIVSTDDQAITEHSLRNSCEVHHRPSSLATDDSRVVDALLDGADVMGLDDQDVVFVLQPTSPMRRPDHISEAAELQSRSASESVVSVVECEHHPLKAVIVEQGKLRPAFDAGSLETSRQKLPRMMRPNGALYASRLSDIRQFRSLVREGALVMEMSPEDSIDIDSPMDLAIAEFMLKQRR